MTFTSESAFDAHHAVKYVYCVLDEVSSGLDNLGDTPDPGLLSLLSRIESAFTYRHYHITQGLSLKLLHGDICCKIATPLRHNSSTAVRADNAGAVQLQCMVSPSTAVDRVSSSFRLPLEYRGHRNEKITCASRKALCGHIRFALVPFAPHSKNHAISSVLPGFQTYSPDLIVNAFHLFDMTVELCDIPSKQRAYEAILQSTAWFQSLQFPSSMVTSIANNFADATALLLRFLNDWNTGCLGLSSSEVPPDEIASIEQLVARGLGWLADKEQRILANSEPPSSLDFSMWYNTDLKQVCEHLLEATWVIRTEHSALHYALLHYSTVLNRPTDERSAKLKQSPQPVSARSLASLCLLPFSWANLVLEKPPTMNAEFIFNLENLECKIESHLSSRLCGLDRFDWPEFFTALVLPSSTATLSFTTRRDAWFRLSRLWGGLCSSLMSLTNLHEILLSETVQALKYTVLSLPRPSALFSGGDPERCRIEDLFETYAGMRFVTNCLRVLQVDKLTQLLLPFTSLHCNSGTHILFWMHPILLGLESDKQNDYCLRIACEFIRELLRNLRGVALPKHTAQLLSHLSAKIVCCLAVCSGPPSVYCEHNRSTRGSSHLTMKDPSALAIPSCYSLAEQIELIDLLLEERNVEGASEAVVDLVTHLSCHMRWDLVDAVHVHSLLTLVHSNLPHFTPAIVGKIFFNVTSQLSEADLTAWLGVHNSVMPVLSAVARQGPSSALTHVGIDEYRIMQYGAFALCLAKHYTRMLAVQPNPAILCELTERRTSNEGCSSTVSSNSLVEALVNVLAALCRLGLVHQYTHALYGAVYFHIENVISAVRMKPVHVLRLARDRLAQVVADHVDQPVKQLIDCLSRLFQLNKADIFKELISPLFIALVLRGNQESHVQIRQLVAEVPYIRAGQDYVNKLIQLCVLPDALVHIFTKTSKDEQEVHFAFLESHLGMPIERIARLNDVSRLMHQFVLRLYPYRVGASLGLRWIASRVLALRDSQSTSTALVHVKGPASADFLGHFVCGILAFFDTTLLDDDTMLEHRWIALRSLVVFIQLLGSTHVTRMRAKFMATLKICLRYKTAPFAKVVIKAWRSFIRTLEIEAVCELLPDLGATLVGLLPCGSGQVMDLFNYLFLEKREEIGDRLSCMFFIPRVPILLTYQEILDDLCSWRSLDSSDSTTLPESFFRRALCAWLSALTHSSRSVRRLALTSELGDADTVAGHPTVARLWNMSSLVKDLSSALPAADGNHDRDSASEPAIPINHLESSETPGQVIRSNSLLLGDLISALLEGLTRDTDERMRLLYAQWLGNLGAIDPGRISLSMCVTSTTTGPAQISQVNDPSFSFFILCELAKIYLRAASPKQLDSTALAIQELLKLFRIPEGGKLTGANSSTAEVADTTNKVAEDVAAMPFVSGTDLWKLFPDHLCDLFAPLTTSRYAVEAFTDWSTVRSPLITSCIEDLNFESWIRLWAGSLCANIRSEILTVLTEVASAMDSGTSDPSSLNDVLLTTTMSEMRSSNHGCRDATRWQPWFPLAAQTVFGLLDHLGRWYREQEKALRPQKQTAYSTNNISKSTSKTASTEAVKRVGDFLQTIPHLLQAKASLKCGGLARALLHWELAYDEDELAGKSAFNTGAALMSSSSDRFIPGPGSKDLNQRTSRNPLVLGSTGLSAIAGLLDTYTLLRDTDGLAGVLAVSQLAPVAQALSWAKSNSADEMHIPFSRSERFSALRALELENEEQLHMAAAAYEHNLASSELESTHLRLDSATASSVDSAELRRLMLYGGLFRCELSDPARLHGLVERAGGLISRANANCPGISVHHSARWRQRLNAYRAEAAWRLCDWGTLQETTNLDPQGSSWSVDLGRLFLAINNKDTTEFSGTLSKLRLNQMNELSAAALEGPGGYARAYETIARLSSLSDVELVSSLGERLRLALSGDCVRNGASVVACRKSHGDLQTQVEAVLTLLDTRLKICQPTFHTLEPCLAVHHTSLHLLWMELRSLAVASPNDQLITTLLDRVRLALGQNWLQRAKLTRKSGQFMAAYTCVLRAEAFGIPQALIERAKLLWQTDKREAAQACLDKGIPELYGTFPSEPHSSVSSKVKNPLVSNKSLQEAMLLRARYCEETSRFDFEATQRMYEEVCTLNEGCEEAHFRLARYVDQACSLATVAKQHHTLLKAALMHYGLALSYGSQFIYQSMPRLLSLWLDYGTDCARHTGAPVSTKSNESRVPTDQRTFQEVQETRGFCVPELTYTQIMLQNIQKIPPYQYYTALGQILSRICHEVPTIVTTLLDLVVRIFEAYPLQTIWFLMPLNDSSVRQRRDRCQQVFSAVKSRQPTLTKFITDSITLCNHLRTICGLFMSADRRELRSFSLHQSQRPLARLIENSDFSRILIPIHRQLVPNLLPARASYEQVKKHWPFGPGPDQLVCLAHMDDTVEILGSQTRPKKMTWIGSDGRRYIIVAKPNDDLRKDSRLMELNGMINKFLVKNPDTRRRALHIRTYAVIPLSEKGGLIEWVSNTEPFRAIITRLYTESGRPINWAAMSRVAPLLEDPLPVKRDKYLNKWLPMFPLVFHRWFLDTFPNPSAWYSARESYARTCAVMSMVGYVLGLGDRHTENILFDSTTGSVVHVDFSCVFNNGLTLPWPERVPFRLTRNMVRALGPTGFEGIFRRCAEAVMRLLRHEIDPLLAVFRPLYFDALVEQGGNTRGSVAGTEASGKIRRAAQDHAVGVSNDLADRVAQAAAEKLTNMEDRLHGKITEHDGFSQILPMSVEGQVDVLIKEATDVDRLCQMYKGWMPFL
ncbi:ataxia telangiectasia and Rad3 related protein [Clonorchis sinensis]|uniref:Serine/threonine-protein kinase ATR n=1 Tax=Clonorchis sinensis TaxID=79923 RepID=G7Y406_CLOSI|nr:ataxia telangiectasia and Rad3 related protein [Clonorchis sinensis]